MFDLYVCLIWVCIYFGKSWELLISYLENICFFLGFLCRVIQLVFVGLFRCLMIGVVGVCFGVERQVRVVVDCYV